MTVDQDPNWIRIQNFVDPDPYSENGSTQARDVSKIEDKSSPFSLQRLSLCNPSLNE